MPWYLVALLLAGLVLAVYWQVGGHLFVNFDDNVYVSENPQVLRGLTPESVSWAFATVHGDNWYPLTWLSYMADVELFGLDAGWHHRVNMLLHLANTVLLFLVLWRMTGGMWQSGFVAALFGVHPLHVESVAWVSERKDVLSALFWMLTMGAYLRYARRPTVGRYLAVAALLALGLMSKPMLVTLPCVLLLLDWWPLGRLKPAASLASPSAQPVLGRLLRLVWEKVPLFGLAAASGAMTYLAQAMGGSTSRIMDLTLGSRVSNAVVSYAVQLWRTVWPSSLGPFYPHPASIHADIPAWAIIASVLLLSGLTVVVLRQAGGRPYLAVGWFWFVGTMVPVIGLIQTGSHATADRFTYLPLVGVFIAIAWGIPAALPEWRFRRATLAVGGGAVVLALAGAAWTQVGYWRDSEALWSRALAVTDRNWLALNNLGDVYYRLGRYQQALGYFQEAVRIKPDYVDGLHNLGLSHQALGQHDRAIAYLENTARLEPGYRDLWRDLGHSYFALGRYQEAVRSYREALRFNPDDVETWNRLGVSYGLSGEHQQAIGCFREALRIKPDYAPARDNLALTIGRFGQSR